MPKTKQSIQNTTPAINRIVIGDVGSGKTIVAFLVALCYLQGLEHAQASLLAPTEVLAYQHYIKLCEMVELEKTKQAKVRYKEFFEKLVVIFLSGKLIEINGIKYTPAKYKAEIIKLKESKKHFFWVGTHALLFAEHIAPDLVLVDEQHRFGVRQRAKLSELDSELSPHFISFTATPIPRTLALTMYQSLKPHFLEKLADRNPIINTINTFENLETEVVAKIQSELALGHKAYVICPAVEETEDTEEKKALFSVKKATTILENYFGTQVFSVHGKMKEKKDILTEFKESDTKNILVATTVVEVGVDVGKASLVIILNAERFGLSALHQIRGRVGRNDFDRNYCILVTEQKYSYSKRLKYLTQYQDGFKLAELDLELRGAGDMTGQSQSGFGDEVGEMLGLDPDTYGAIAQQVIELNLSDTDNLLAKLPRLYAYLEKEKARVWEE